ncbi:unnamed protein product [Schistocephalus solidus]|uniref:Uncharacterized protein n=1 Tax=Schistocephalus solidus TaxID=70667 RepID=A0A183SQA6_SCHSO|nr:unnamed protein product [Schistocephalus solidus]
MHDIHRADGGVLRTDATKAVFFRCRHLVRRRLWERNDVWNVRQAEKIHGYVDRNEMKTFFKDIKAIYGDCIKGTAQQATVRYKQKSNKSVVLTHLLDPIFSTCQPATCDDLTRLMAELTTLFQDMWCQGQVPQIFKDATIVHLYKREGNRQLCDNHRGISLLNITGKTFTRIPDDLRRDDPSQSSEPSRRAGTAP